MSLSLHTIRSQKGSKKTKKRVGRGLGSTGTYSGRGVKGQTARSGVSGLQKLGIRPLMLSTPKSRGFKSGKPRAQAVNVGDISNLFSAGAKVTPSNLEKKGLIVSAVAPVKVLAGGEMTYAITLADCAVSAAAKEKIEKAGGTVVER